MEKSISRHIRKLDIDSRRDFLKERYNLTEEEVLAMSGNPVTAGLPALMVETALGLIPVPLGLASGFVIDGEEYLIPMATEEASVIAAASYSAKIIAEGGGGFTTWNGEPIMQAQVYLEDASPAALVKIEEAGDEIRRKLHPLLASMEKRGGGFRSHKAESIPDLGLIKVTLSIDVRDAMGANLLNEAAEQISPLLEDISGGKRLMSILTNSAEERRAGAGFSLPINKLKAAGKSRYASGELAERIVKASMLASLDKDRAVTHNKGIMNGISALCLATGNDTRAIEAAAHAWACGESGYSSLTTYSIEGQNLIGRLELPLALGTVGGAVNFHPVSRAVLKVLGNPNAQRLSRIAAALGLAQNFAAVLALVSSGIQKGHMKLHAAKIAYSAGARGETVAKLVERMTALGDYRLETAKSLLQSLESSDG